MLLIFLVAPWSYKGPIHRAPTKWQPLRGRLASVPLDPQGPGPSSSVSKALLPLVTVPSLRGILVPAVKIMDFPTQLCDASIETLV